MGRGLISRGTCVHRLPCFVRRRGRAQQRQRGISPVIGCKPRLLSKKRNNRRIAQQPNRTTNPSSCRRSDNQAGKLGGMQGDSFGMGRDGFNSNQKTAPFFKAVPQAMNTFRMMKDNERAVRE